MNTLLFFLFLLLPSYLLRFHLGPLPSTALEIIVLTLGGTFFVQNIFSREKRKNILSDFTALLPDHPLFFLGTALFVLGATISIFTSVDRVKALGEWRAFYIEPIFLFCIIATYIKSIQSEKRKEVIQKYILLPLLLSGVITAGFAIYQHFTGFFVPFAFWQNRNTYRVTGWYGFPNAVGLFLAPLIPLSLYVLKQNYELRMKYKEKFVTHNFLSVVPLLSLLTIPFALVFAKGSGPIIGAAAGIGVILLLYKKTRWAAIFIGMLGIASLFFIPKTNPLKQELLFQDRSAQIRLFMWQDTKNFLKDHPFAGAGLASYEERMVPYHSKVNGESVEIFHHPHNIFLTMWVNTGIIGLLGFLLILIGFYITGMRYILQYAQAEKLHKSKTSTTILPTFLISAMTVIVVMGFVDSPYIKNDLAIVFWMLPTILLSL